MASAGASAEGLGLPGFSAEREATKGTNKASGYEFYNKLGCPKHIVAPMVNQSELAFRMLCRKYGADLAYTPMIHAGMIKRNKRHFKKAFGTHKDDRPLITQFCANTPESFLDAARLVEGNTDGIDLNLGCPQGIAKRGHYGAFLLEESQLIKEMITTAHLHLDTPVTAKIRILPKGDDTIALAKLIQESGAQILTVHGRTREMLQHKLGKCDFDIIRRIKQELKIPVFSNGGIELFEDVGKCMKHTGADGVMVSEALLENPAFFSGRIPDTVDIAREFTAFAKKYPCPLAHFAYRPHMFKLMYRDLMKYTDLRTFYSKAPNEVIAKGPDIILKRRAAEKEFSASNQSTVDEKFVSDRHEHIDLKFRAHCKDSDMVHPTLEWRKLSWYRRHQTRREIQTRIDEEKRKKREAERLREEKEGREGRVKRFSIFDDDVDSSEDEAEDGNDDDEADVDENEDDEE
eukprot:CAMPEP_0114507124 /NCGR_PEP_ID=MMETSP0109-20121206/11835_1 /TAXON_ID=29199 /ORGANISM="Chlorarachnion reptans, Strain CCCM449" /LENGTH=460 /DNA_ID=CAMNT_0001685841 /DNA_START=19 /DNA_END=1401 /DNA_ORIENTATION=-